MGQTIEELLKSMLTFPEAKQKGDFVGLENTREIWRRIGQGDSFQEMGFENEDAKNKWLSEWCAENPYSSIQ
jgi:hypothetical protein